MAEMQILQEQKSAMSRTISAVFQQPDRALCSPAPIDNCGTDGFRIMNLSLLSKSEGSPYD
jgi:hypothetical protein